MEDYAFQKSDGSFIEQGKKEYTPHKSTRYINVAPEHEKKLPELYEKRENCSGCSACFAVCSKTAIVMIPDEEGFLYPVVDAARCVCCYKCLNVCAFKEAQKEKRYL